jgi:branched-chain amino acid transport system ATP-binding protein
MLEVRQIDVRYGKRTSVSQLSLHVKAGEIVTLVGGNGAGKTTTLKAVSGLLPLAHGEIWFCGERMDALAPHQILAKGLAHVPEGRMLFKDMSVKAHLELGSLRTPAHAASFNDTLAWVFELFPVLKERSQQLAGTLSGGQQQMLAIARGLMSQPRLLMLDEPSLGLAPIVVDTLVDIIRTLHAKGLSILLVEQRVDLALQLAQRAYVMESGQVTLSGAAADLARDPKVKQAYLGLSL